MRLSRLKKTAMATVAAAALVAAPMAAGADDGAPNSGGLGADGLTPFHVFSSSQDGGTRVQLSTDGNMYGFEGPAGYEHINTGGVHEGYVICYTVGGVAKVAYDSGAGASGMGATTSASSSSTGATFVRRTADNAIQLRQQFTFRGVEKRVFIQNTLRNTSGQPITDITFRRIVDFDTDTGGANGWTSFVNWHASTSVDSIHVWSDPADAPAGLEAHGMMLRAMRGGQSRFAQQGGSPGSCPATPGNTTPVVTDVFTSMDFQLGGLPIGSSKSVKVDYFRT